MAALPDTPIARLKPKSSLHAAMLSHLNERLDFSERRMSGFYSRWQANELRAQAYLSLPDYEQILKEANDSGEPPKAVSIIVPYGFAAMQTISTYLLHTFAGRKPMFQIGSYNTSPTGVQGAMAMEKVIDYNSTHTRMIKHLWQGFNDVQLYGLSVKRCLFKKEEAMRSRWRAGSQHFMDQLLGNSTMQSVREKQTVFEGNDIQAWDPFFFFPDPRVGMQEVARKGEFVFFLTHLDKIQLQKMELNGELNWVEAIERNEKSQDFGQSRRNLLAKGDQPRAYEDNLRGSLREPMEIFAGTCEIIPSEIKGSDGAVLDASRKTPEKWLFVWANRTQILKAEPFESDHDRHPVAVSEPYSLGYGFGAAGLFDYMNPLQDLMSWLINSHMFNVRQVLNNMMVVDPSRIEMQDLKNPEPGKLIRLKRAAFGQDVRETIFQLQMVDITRSHLADMQLIMRLADSLSGATDNLRGLQDSGGRKTATEIRGASEAGGSRLAALAKVISAQEITDLTEMMVLNIQQFMSPEFYLKLLGQDEFSALLAPEIDFTGDYYYPIHDGTLPMDKVALFDIWQQMLGLVLPDQQLRMTYDIPRLIEFVGKLGGAQNMDQFRMPPAPALQSMAQPAIDAQMQAGNVIPLNQAAGSGLVNAAPAAPGQRAAGGM